MSSIGREVNDKTVFLLAGGLGTRLGKLTEQSPKSMVPVLGKPFIHYKLKEIADQCISSVVVCAGHFSAQIMNFVEDGSKWGLNVEYSLETQQLLGTGGALSKALKQKPVHDLYVVYGDSLLYFDYDQLQFPSDSHAAVMAVFRGQNYPSAGNVSWNSKTGFAEYFQNPDRSLHHMDYGVSRIRTKSLLDFADGKDIFHLGEYFEEVGKRRLLHGVEALVPFQEIGSESGLANCEKFLLGENR
jgi:NDP-sugar pyrophosphorylase family protein